MEPVPDNAKAPDDPPTPLAWDTIAALLGGAAAATVRGDDTTLADPSAAELVAALDSPRAWLTPGHEAAANNPAVAREFALEIASIKIRCFAGLVRMLLDSGHAGPLATTRIFGTFRDHHGAVAPTRWSLAIGVRTEGDAAGSTPSLSKDLGILMARLLFSNDQCPPSKAEGLALAATSSFTEAIAKQAGAATAHFEAALAAVLNSHEIANPACTVHAAELRTLLVPSSIPRHTWLAIAQLCVRLLADVPGYAFGEAPLLDLCAALNAIGRKLDIATFGATARREEIAAAIRSQA